MLQFWIFCSDKTLFLNSLQCQCSTSESPTVTIFHIWIPWSNNAPPLTSQQRLNFTSKFHMLQYSTSEFRARTMLQLCICQGYVLLQLSHDIRIIPCKIWSERLAVVNHDTTVATASLYCRWSTVSTQVKERDHGEVTVMRIEWIVMLIDLKIKKIYERMNSISIRGLFGEVIYIYFFYEGPCSLKLNVIFIFI